MEEEVRREFFLLFSKILFYIYFEQILFFRDVGSFPFCCLTHLLAVMLEAFSCGIKSKNGVLRERVE
jgi:hypothetical protein